MSEKKSSTEGVKRPRIDTERFLDAWIEAHENGGSQADVAATMGCSIGGVYVKAKRLVEEGVNLPALSTGRKASIDVDALNARLSKFKNEEMFTVTPTGKREGTKAKAKAGK
jgi:hypothetical protein